MGVINSATLTAINKGFNKLFQEGRKVGRDMSNWRKIARRVTSSAASEVYGWIEVVPQMRKWSSGDRTIGSVKEQAYELANDEFESTIGVKATDIKDDRLGMYAPLMEDLGVEGEYHIDRGSFAALKAGRTTDVSDGKKFFATDHPRAANTDGTGANTPTSNILLPGTTDTAEWYLLHTMGLARPIIYQEREALRFDSFDDFQDSRAFLKNEFLYGIYARRQFGFSRWQYAVSCRAALTKDNFRSAVKMMQEFKRDGGDPWGLSPTLLVVPPALRGAARDIVVAERGSDGSTNTEAGVVDLHVEPLLA